MTQLQITGMTCDACATHVRQALEKVPGVHSADVSYRHGTAQLAMTSDTPLAALDAAVAAVASLGYRAALAEAGLEADERLFLGQRGTFRYTGGNNVDNLVVAGAFGLAQALAPR